jgi:ankyrin repeat protein
MGHLEVVKFLVESGKADVNKADTNGITPLCIASQMGHLEVVKFLVESGKADVNKADTDGRTTLWIASHTGSQSCQVVERERCCLKWILFENCEEEVE